MTAPGRPKVSVCVPAYLAERYLAETIESVLAQTFTDWELVVLDNASPDRTGAIARSYTDPRIRVERNRSVLALADNWNAVAALARGQYLKILCADDLLAPGCLAREVDALDHHPEVVMTAARRDFISSSGRRILRNRGLQDLLGMKRPIDAVDNVVRSGANPIGWPSALLLRRADFEAVGGFDRRWLHPIDLDLWLRLLSRGCLYGIDQSLVAFRISPGSVTARVRGAGPEYRDMLRAFAASSPWPIGRIPLALGLARSRLAQIWVWLLFRAVNSERRLVRSLPTLVLEGRRPAPRWSGYSEPTPRPDWSAGRILHDAWMDGRPGSPADHKPA